MPVHRGPRTRTCSRALRPQVMALFALSTLGFFVCAPDVSRAAPVFPAPTYPGCGDNESLASCPPDFTNADGSWRGITWSFVSFIAPELKHRVRPEELSLGSGNWIDKAFQLSTGRYDVPIAVIDSGIRWRASELTPKTLLSRGELPPPRDAAGKTCISDDCNRDGYFTVADYANDSRVNITFGYDDADYYLDPSDLIEAFQDGLDNDNNGFIDDIAGWDFLWNDNNPVSSNDFYHGTAVLTDAAAMLGDPGSDLGYCPNCAILPVRVSDSFMGEGNKIAQGVLYAVDRGVKVIAIAMGGVTNSQFLKDAFAYAYAHDVTIITAIGDELSYHHLPPGANEYAFPVHSIEFYPIYGVEFARTFLAFNGCNNYGSHLMLVAATNDCATGSTAIISGIAGLVYSRGLDNGLELSADEVRAILTRSADDINVRESQTGTSNYFPSWPGWDQFFGYGRVNARRAVELAQPYKVPPEVRIHHPQFYDVLDPRRTPTLQIDAHLAAPRTDSFSWTLEWAPGADVRDSGFTLLKNGVSSSALDGVIYSWPASSIPREMLDPAEPVETISGDDPLLTKLEKVNAHAITLRLTAVDDLGNKAEHRKTFFLHADPDLLSGFPLLVGPGESSPSLYDVNGDGVQEIVVGTSDGKLHVLLSNAKELAGFPVQVGPMIGTDPASPDGHSSSKPYAEDQIVPARQGILGNVTPTDLEGDGKAEILVSTLDGKLYVFGADGKLRAGFPVTRDPVSDADTDLTHMLDPGIAASPVPADLDGDGVLEIVLPAMDQHVYVWRADGSRQPGFPVKLEGPDSDVTKQGRIFSSPAVGDINGDGTLEIVVGSNEFKTELPVITYLYALHGDGNLNAEGPFVRGWPITVVGLLSSVVGYVGDGLTMTPILTDLENDGAMDIVITSLGGCPQVIDGRGRVLSEMACDESGWGPLRNTDEVGGLTYLANVTVADVDEDGDPDIVAGMTCLNWGLSLLLNKWMPYQDHVVGVWDAKSGQALDAWPRVIEDIMMFVKPEVADISGDGAPDVLMSSGGYTLQAWEEDGTEVVGWPKFTGGWIYTAIRAGDISGDGLNEVVALTRKGYLWAWNSDGLAEDVSSKVPAARAISTRQPGPAKEAVRPSIDARPLTQVSPGALSPRR